MLNQSIDLWGDATFDFAAAPLDDFDIERPQLVGSLSTESLKQHDSLQDLETENPQTLSLFEDLGIEIPRCGIPERVETPSYGDTNIVSAHSSADCGSDTGFGRLTTRRETEDGFEMSDEFGPLTPHAVHIPPQSLPLENIPTEATMIVHDFAGGTPRSLPRRLSLRPIQISRGTAVEEGEDWGWSGFSSEDDDDDEKTDYFCRTTYTPNVVMLPLKNEESAIVIEDEAFVPLHEATGALPSRCEGFRRHVRNRFDLILSFLDEKIEEQEIALSDVRRRGGS